MIEPFTYTGWNVVLWYVASVIAMFVMVGVSSVIGLDIDQTDRFSQWTLGEAWIVVVVIMPVVEEIVFRAFPKYLFGSIEAIAIGSVVWALVHEKRVLIILPIVPLYVKLWAGGFMVEAVAVHVIHNAWVMVLYTLGRVIE